MNLNLPWPWSERLSPPAVPWVSFSAPDGPDSLLFESGPELRIRVQAALHAIRLNWTLHRNMVNRPVLSGSAVDEPGYRFDLRIPTATLSPGFYDLWVELDTGVEAVAAGPLPELRPVRALCTFGWRVESVPEPVARPADFEAFWNRARAELAAVPVDWQQESPWRRFDRAGIEAYNLRHAGLPANYDPDGVRYEEVESCQISFAGPDGGRVYAQAAKPPGLGPFPGLLILPGGGFNARPRPLEHARHGYFALDLQVHGERADLLEYTEFPGYYSGQRYEPPEAYYFYRIHQRILLGFAALAAQPEVVPERIAACGGSQGGRTGIVLAGLEPRLAALVAALPHFANQAHWEWLERCNEAESDGGELVGAPPVPATPRARCLAYYDPLNFGPEVRCPVLMNAGLIDRVSPPYATWAVFRALASADKTWVPLPGLAHDWSSAFDRRAWRWLERKLNL